LVLVLSVAFSEDSEKHVVSSAVRLRKLKGMEQVKHQANLLNSTFGKKRNFGFI
jgi:hypothetical protein